MEETRSTLQFAARAKKVRSISSELMGLETYFLCHLQVRLNPSVKEYLDPESQNRKLRRELNELREKQRLADAGGATSSVDRALLEEAQVKIEKYERMLRNGITGEGECEEVEPRAKRSRKTWGPRKCCLCSINRGRLSVFCWIQVKSPLFVLQRRLSQ